MQQKNTPDPSPLAKRMLELLARHRSVRNFVGEENGGPLPPGLLEDCVRAAQMASTSSHIQAYALLQVTDPAERRELADWSGGQAQVHEAETFFVVLGDVRRHALAAERAGRPLARNLETFLLAVIDASLFAQNLCVALEAQGLGICFIGGLRNRLEDVDRLLELPRDVFPLFGLCVGRPAPEEKKRALRPRLPLEAVLLQGRYPSDTAMLEFMDEHDRVMAECYADQGHPGRNWSGGLVRRMEKPQRENLKAYYRSKGAAIGCTVP